MTKNLFLEILNALVTLVIMISMIYLLFILPGCQFLQEHPKLIQDAEEVGEKILEYEISHVAKSSYINSDLSDLEANHVCP